MMPVRPKRWITCASGYIAVQAHTGRTIVGTPAKAIERMMDGGLPRIARLNRPMSIGLLQP